MEASISYITHHDILNFPFPHKLWLMVNLECYDFLRWNRDGTVILVDLVALENYLNSTRSIFKIKNSSQFLEHLVEFKFERLNALPEDGEDLLLQYRNENFQRHRLDLLAKIRRHTYQLLGEISTDKEDNVCDQFAFTSKRASERMFGDLCFMSHGALSSIYKSRLRFQTMLHFHNETRILKEKLLASDANQHRKSKPDGHIRSSLADEDRVIELPVELFENPHDSVLNLGDDYRPEYAGYYGNCSKELIMRFFGDYLPKYEDGSMEVKKIVADSGNGNVFVAPTSIISSDPNMIQYCPSNIAGNSNISISNSAAENSVININVSSNLEPIFQSNENYDDINPNNPNCNNNVFTVTEINSNNFDADPDISMDEFIKFKDTHVETFSNNLQEINDAKNEDTISKDNAKTINAFPQMPSAVKVEITEDVKENEANFRNFFSQYRASLNLLYERQ